MSKKPEPPFPPQPISPPGLEARMHPKPRYQAENYRPAGKLADRKALITGGDSGIGRAVAVLFAREGADVAIAPVYVFFASNADSGYISGEVLPILGGETVAG